MQGVVVQKFGGTSVATRALRERVAAHVERVAAAGGRPVVVVSAMGRLGEPYATDTLLKLFEEVTPDEAAADGRDLDLLLSCGEVISTVLLAQLLRARGHRSVALTGAQAGVITDDRHGNARILRVEPERVLAALAEGVIPVVAGFQGRNERGDVTTLGRGGSDTTAAALAVVLGAEALEVFTDVDGVKTADPRIEPEAVTLERVTYQEVAELAHLGAKVIHPRAIEIAMNGKVPVKILPTAAGGRGTLVSDGRPRLEGPGADRPVTGIAHVPGCVRVVVAPPPGETGAAVRLFEEIGSADISVDMIHVSPERIGFIIEGKASRRVEGILRGLGWPYTITPGVAKVSAVGAGMHGVPGIMARIARSLHRAGVPILETTDSHANISCLVPEDQVAAAVKALHHEFELGLGPQGQGGANDD